MSGSYQTTTLLRATAELAERLTDPSMVRWTADELQGYLIEALRTWNALTSSFRDHGTFQTTANRAFYDLPTVLPALRGYTVTSGDLVKQLEYHLLEPPVTTTWIGSDQFDLADLVSALQRRRDQFLLETGMVLTRQLLPISPPPNGRISLEESIVTLRRLAWQQADGTISRLHREDVWALNHFAIGWVQEPDAPPTCYSAGETPPLTVQVFPVPLDSGLLDVIAVTRGAVLDPLSASLLGMPDDWTWVVKFGALADVLSLAGLGFDPLRAQYCEQRWQQGLEAAKGASVVWAARIGNVVAELNALHEADEYLDGWQTSVGTPTRVFTTGGNLIALGPVPDQPGVDEDYSVTLDLVVNASIPASTEDFLQVGPELLDTIYDYAQHLALIKEGSDAIQSSLPLLERFFRMAGVTISIDLATTHNRDALTEQTRQDDRQTARTVALT